MKKITSTYSRNISFGDFTINPGEIKMVADNFEIPSDWQSHLHWVEEERIETSEITFAVKTGKTKNKTEDDE